MRQLYGEILLFSANLCASTPLRQGLVVVFAVRTRLPFFRSRPGMPLLLAALGIVAATLWLPYSPLAGLLGFAPLPISALILTLVIVVLYFITAETANHFFYRSGESCRATGG